MMTSTCLLYEQKMCEQVDVVANLISEKIIFYYSKIHLDNRG